VALGSAMGLLSATTAWAAPMTGPAGIGDPYYPLYGNGGYDVSHYDIAVGYQPATDLVTGTTVITAKATQDLRRFNLDFALTAQVVRVNGAHARFSQDDPHELVVTPAADVRRGSTMTVSVTYAGVPSATRVRGLAPWIRTADGAVAVGEPEIAAWWYPSNDHPRDKATFDIAVTVPTGLEAISNGRLLSTTRGVRFDTWRWRESKPMVTYLAFMAVGQYDVTQGTTSTGLPWLNAVASNGGSEGRFAAADLARTPEIIDLLSRVWGPYPFDSIGGVAPNASFGFALENQTRPVYSRVFWAGGPNIYVVVHESAHQWYGDSVSIRNWRDIWLNEGFATFTEWLWSERHGEGTAQELLTAYYNDFPAASPFWDLSIGNPGARSEFAGQVYDRGAMTLQALRNRVGSPAFFQIMRNWAAQHRYGNGSIAEFIALAERSSGQDLRSFFQHWLYDRRKPAATVENGFPRDFPAVSADIRARGAAAVPSKAKIDAAHRLLTGHR